MTKKVGRKLTNLITRKKEKAALCWSEWKSSNRHGGVNIAEITSKQLPWSQTLILKMTHPCTATHFTVSTKTALFYTRDHQKSNKPRCRRSKPEIKLPTLQLSGDRSPPELQQLLKKSGGGGTTFIEGFSKVKV